MEALYSRFVENLDYAEVSNEQGYVNDDAARYYINLVLKQLKAMGFKPRSKV